MLTIPTCALLKSSSLKPIAYNIACAAGCVTSCVNVFEYLFNSAILIFMLSSPVLLSSSVVLHHSSFGNSIQLCCAPMEPLQKIISFSTNMSSQRDENHSP